MRAILAVLALAGSLALATAPAAEPAAKLPAVVAAGVKSVAGMCQEVGGKAQTADAVKRADLSGDGQEDFVLYTGWVSCEGMASLYGDREKAITVWAADGTGGATEAFNGAVFDAKLEGTGEAAKLWLTVSGAQCGKPPAPDFAHENFCDRALVWNAKAKKLDYAPVSTVRMIE